MKLLLTGVPGCGKTTLLRRVIETLGCNVGGFSTQEIRNSDNDRVGFEVVTMTGQSAVLAHTDLRTLNRVGRYGVDVVAVNCVAVPAIQEAIEARADVIVIDEIGPMQLLSEEFQGAVLAAIVSDSIVLATIVLRSYEFANELKVRSDVQVIEVNEHNRKSLAYELRNRIMGRLRSQKTVERN